MLLPPILPSFSTSKFLIWLLSVSIIYRYVGCEVVQLDSTNFETVIAGSDIVFVNFYADWCRFSQQLKPIFLKASEEFEIKTDGIKVTWGTVDSEVESAIAQKYHVRKFPTLKLFRHGELVKKEYRGQRSVEALSEFVKKQLIVPFKKFFSLEDLAKIDKSKDRVILYMDQESGSEFESFKKVASVLKEECTFLLGIGNDLKEETGLNNKLYFQSPKTNENYEYRGELADYSYLREWLTDKCVPLVREITFDNAEELTEEGLPFLILFRHRDDSTIEKIYVEQVVRELYDQKNSINCLIADGKTFAHPLHHLGKSEKDLPLIAIDSFRHMYIFPDMNELTLPGKLRQFVLDLHSGKLHKQFHHRFESTEKPIVGVIGSSENEDQKKPGNKTLPPTSVFKQLKPSESRYSLLEKDEL